MQEYSILLKNNTIQKHFKMYNFNRTFIKNDEEAKQLL